MKGFIEVTLCATGQNVLINIKKIVAVFPSGVNQSFISTAPLEKPEHMTVNVPYDKVKRLIEEASK